MKTLYTAQVTAVGGRTGRIESTDGAFQLQLAMPKELGGAGGAGTNPEQLFAAGYAACFDSALAFVAQQQRQKLVGTRVQATVAIGPRAEGGFALAVELVVTIPGVARELAQQLLERAHQVCPYSNAIRDNVEVSLRLA